MDDLVRTESGTVRGVTSGEVTAYLGIPYAAPLLGRSRFRAPGPAPRWRGVRDATAPAASVPQPEHPQAPRAGADPHCLAVNVWTPRGYGDGLPVLVWLHGGGFVAGSASSPDFDGARLAAHGVVLVSLNYRVGYEGMGWVADAPGNRSLLDQLAALEWVRDNIAAFGGDPGRVTVFGQSAGASSIAALAASNAAAGLFRRAIVQSPGNVFVPADEARAVSAMITDELGVAPTTEALAAVPSRAFHAVQWNPVLVMSERPGEWTHPHSPYAIALDGELLERRPWESPRIAAIDLVSGAMADEARLYTATLPQARTDLLTAARGVGLTETDAARYRAARPEATEAELSALVATDAMFRMPARRLARAHAAAGGRTHHYEFAWPVNPVLGACHGLDVPFVFGVPDGPLARDYFGDTVPSDFEPLSAAIRAAWVGFAVTGDPGWPRHEPDAWLSRIWAAPPSVASDPTAASGAIWDGRA